MDEKQIETLTDLMRRVAYALADLEALQAQASVEVDEEHELEALQALAAQVDTLTLAELFDLLQRAARLEQRLLRRAPRWDAQGRLLP